MVSVMYGHPVTPPKPRWKSKTYLVNGVVLLLLAAETNLKVLQPLLSVNVYQLAAFILPVVNFVLREYTDRGVGSVRQPAPPSGADADSEHW